MKSLKDVATFFTSMGSTPGSVGIDVGGSSIKVVELQEKDNVLTLSSYGELQLGPYQGKELGEVVQLESKLQQEALVDVIRESGVTVRDAVFAMPLSSSFVTNVSVEAQPDADLSSVVRIEARKVIPASLSEVALDWAEVERISQTKQEPDSSRRDILIAAIQNTALERFKVLMQFAGFRNPPTEIECFSAIRSLYNTSTPTTAIIDIGANSSKLYITHEAFLMRMHRVRAGGAIVTDNIARERCVDFATAEAKKLAVTKSDEDFTAIKKIHHHTYDRAFREFGQVMREFEKKTGQTIERVHLAGGGALFPGIQTFLQESIRKEVVLADPFAKVAYPAFMEDVITTIGPSFVVALGAALRDFE